MLTGKQKKRIGKVQEMFETAVGRAAGQYIQRLNKAGCGPGEVESKALVKDELFELCGRVFLKVRQAARQHRLVNTDMGTAAELVRELLEQDVENHPARAKAKWRRDRVQKAHDGPAEVHETAMRVAAAMDLSGKCVVPPHVAQTERLAKKASRRKKK